MRPAERGDLRDLPIVPPHSGQSLGLGATGCRADCVKIGAGIIRLRDAAGARIYIPDMIRDAGCSGDGPPFSCIGMLGARAVRLAHR
jgi:hypothetical protein